MNEHIERTIRKLNGRMHRHGDDLRANEALTRYALIDPVLTTLRWDLSDPCQVIAEYRPTSGKREAVDYKIERDSFAMIIEAKALDTDLRRYERGLNTYATMCRKARIEIRLSCLTNGDVWRIFDTRKNFEKVAEFSLSSDILGHCVANLNELSIMNVEYQEGKSFAEPLHGRIPMTGICPRDRLPKPSALIFSDGERKRVKAWKDVKLHTYDWLKLKLPSDYNVRKRSHSSQVLKDTSRLFCYCNEEPSETCLVFS